MKKIYIPIILILLGMDVSYAAGEHKCVGDNDGPLSLEALVSSEFAVSHKNIESSTCIRLPISHEKFQDRPTSNQTFLFLDYRERKNSQITCEVLEWDDNTTTDGGCENRREIHIDYPDRQGETYLWAPRCRVTFPKTCPIY